AVGGWAAAGSNGAPALPADEAAVAAWDARAADLRSRRDRLAARQSTSDGERRNAEARRARAEATVALEEARLARIDREVVALGEREDRLADERRGIAVELATATSHEASAAAALGDLRAADAADRDRLGTAERDAAAARDRLRAADDRLRAAVGVAARGWGAQPPLADAPSPGRLATLRRRYHELGAANPFAVQEYDGLRQRLEGLETQARDLRDAIDKTRQLIAELNGMIADQFRTTFAALETAFDARFQQLFGGGFARLSLTDPTDLAATGVEIVARPPGKKAQALAMLSGGERALTAVALLFAMLEVRPVPFCVLDEVDAALDEANVGRFSNALRGLAASTQFIIITHNRGTIEVADAL